MPIDWQVPLSGKLYQAPDLQAIQLKQAAIDEAKARAQDRVAQAKDAEAQRMVMAEIAKIPLIADPETGVLKPDRDAIAQRFGGFMPKPVTDWLDESDKHIGGVLKAQEDSIKRGMAHVTASGFNPAYWQQQVQLWEKGRVIQPQEAAEWGQITDPKQIQQIAGAFTGQKPEYKTAPTTDNIYRTDTGEITTPGVAKPETPVSLQTEKFRVDGKDVMGTFNPRTGQYLLNGEDVTQRARPIPTASAAGGVPTVTIKPATREYRQAQDLADGTLTFAEFNQLHGSRTQAAIEVKNAIYDQARQLNPNFNPSAFEIGYKFASNVKVKQQMASLKNVESGVDDLLKFSDRASRSDMPLFNMAIVPGGVKFGGKTYSNFKTAVTAFADELSGALGYGSATDMSRDMGFSMTDLTQGPANFRSNVEEVILPFVARKKASMTGEMGQYAPGGSSSGQGTPREGEERQIPGQPPGVMAVYRNGKWIAK